MTSLFITSFIAGTLTVFTSSVLPILPILMSGALSGTGRLRPFIISFSLAVSTFVFTAIIKTNTMFIDISETTWEILSASLVGIFGFMLLFPDIWFTINMKFISKNQKFLYIISQHQGVKQLWLLGIALGPVFASSSPTYDFLMTTSLPHHVFNSTIAFICYYAGLFLSMFLIAYSGHCYFRKYGWFASPFSLFRRSLGGVLMILAIIISLGYCDKLQENIQSIFPFDFTYIEIFLIDRMRQ